MKRMRRRNKIGKALLRIAAIVFFLNAAASYGPCCIEMPDSEDVVTNMPCHQTDHDLDKTSSPDDCCLLCVPMMGPTVTLCKQASTVQAINVQAITLFPTNGVDPPFRPPISLLS